MIQFYLEYFNLVALIAGLIVTLSAAILFLLSNRLEQTTKSYFRAIGFGSFAIAYFLLIFERKYNNFLLGALVFELVGFIAILVGVLREPSLTHLKERVDYNEISKLLRQKMSNTLVSNIEILGVFGCTILSVIGLVLLNPTVITSFKYGHFVASFIYAVSLIPILGVIVLQIIRYKKTPGNFKSKLNNFYPILGFVFLFIRSIALVIERLPASQIVFIENLKSSPSVAWEISIVSTILAFIFLGLWAWDFIKVRYFLRTYVSFLAISSLISSLGALIYTILIFNIIAQNNLTLMHQGTQAMYLIMDDRSSTALTLAHSIAADDLIVANPKSFDYYNALSKAQSIFKTSEVDILRVYDDSGQIVLSGSDLRERGNLYDDDYVLKWVLQNKQPIKSFGTEPHILAPIIVARGMYPIVKSDKVLGVIEVGYRMDTAFVDNSRRHTDLDVTIYSDVKRSATTIFKLDGVSRWVGTDENETEVVDNVLKKGFTYDTTLDRLGEQYYSSFAPIKDFQGKIIGMVSVGTPTYLLFENARQQILTAFIIVLLISIFAALLGLLAMYEKFRNYGGESAES
jgi:hypothetical protein